ncbi:MAG: phenylalanine--tRNA ligase subunit alpha [Micropepsaceae bacterium]
MSELESLERQALARIAASGDEAALEATRVDLLGKKGSISEALKTLGSMSPDDRKLKGPIINGMRDRVTAALGQRKASLGDAALEEKLKAERVDVTLPVHPDMTGRIHPVSQILDEATAIFADMGFAIAEGPDIETDDFNFTKLNIPPEHPARQMHDTFYLKAKPDGTRHLLRTHTSPVQARTMLAQKPPIRIIVPGRVYRLDSDQTHTPMFHQIEGLVIDETSHMGHLKWILEEFLRALFEVPKVEMRFRPSYFPFTEPSAEVDIRCDRSGGEVKLGQGNDWLEILGCGMVHPKVIEMCGHDPAKFQGFAWGMGLDRLAMLKYGAPDLRAFFDADLRWLKHYGFSALDVPSLAGGLSR